jgi:tetratricopeptide (TPR) repeat protein
VIGGAARSIERTGLGAELAQLAFDIAGSKLFAKLEPDVQSLLAERALQYAATDGRSDRAERLLAYVRSPYQIMDLLALREYEPLWPQIERYAGDKPEDRDRLTDYAYPLLFAGRDREAIALAQSWLGSRQHEGVLEEGDGWALNIQAYAYDSMGQSADADRVFDRLAQLSAEEHPWVVNFVINRAARLTGLGRWSEALAASDLAKPVAEDHGSPYARMLVATYRACALHKLARVDERDRELEFVRSRGSDAPAAAASALICAGLEDEAAQMLGKFLADEQPARTCRGTCRTNGSASSVRRWKPSSRGFTGWCLRGRTCGSRR